LGETDKDLPLNASSRVGFQPDLLSPKPPARKATRLISAGEIRSADGNRILAKFSSHVDADFFTIIAVVKHHWRLAKGWIGLFSNSLRTLDALHLSIASAEELDLVTADKLLYQAAEILGVRTHLVGG